MGGVLRLTAVVGTDGRVSLPGHALASLGAVAGDELVLDVQRVERDAKPDRAPSDHASAVAEVQAESRALLGASSFTVDDFLADRRFEAARFWRDMAEGER